MMWTIFEMSINEKASKSTSVSYEALQVRTKLTRPSPLHKPQDPTPVVTSTGPSMSLLMLKMQEPMHVHWSMHLSNLI